MICGAGGFFCAGMDLKAFAAGERPHAGGRGFAGITERPPSKPLIAAVEGFAVAGGFEIALACDLIVAARGARLGLPEVKRALVAAAGGLLRLPARIPHHVAMELALTGDPIVAERAHALGLVNRLTDPGEALAGRARSGGSDHPQRPAGAGGDQAHPGRGARLAGGRGVGAPGRARRPGVRLRRRARGRRGLRREARARLARPLTAAEGWRRTRPLLAQTVASSERAPPRSRCSHRYTPCHVPSASRPSRTGRVSDGPSSDALMCAGMSSGPSTVWVQ